MKKLIFASALCAVAATPAFAQTDAVLDEEFAEDSVIEILNEVKTNVQHPIWSRNATIYEVNTRQYTPEGTFEAFAAHLPRLQKLGVDILWFMPIHPISEVNRKGTLGSYYAVRDYKAVNPEFGNLESFKKVVDEAHKLGMKVIIDWVPNHTGCDNAWVAEHPDWYKRNEAGEMYGPYDWTDVFQLDYSNPEMRKGMIDALSYWLKEADIDGFRCDVAGLVPVDFWDEARPALEAVKGKGNLFMLAEATEPELMLNAFDMDYNWPMKDLQNAIAATQGEYTFVKPGETEVAKLPEKHAVDILDMIDEQYGKYPADSYMMNMVTNHDLNSWEGTEYERYGRLLPAMATMTYILPGMPLIYSGQEAGLNRALEFFEKDCITEFDNLKPEAGDTQAKKITEIYTQLNQLREMYPMMWSDTEITLVSGEVLDDPDQLKLYREELGKGLTGYFNFSKNPMPIELPEYFEFDSAWLITADGVTSVAADNLPATIATGEALVVIYNFGSYTEIRIIDTDE